MHRHSVPWYRRWWLRWQASVPTPDTLSRNRWLRPLAQRLSDPLLWRMRPESVARGVAIGVFWAFALPVAQIFFAVVHCVWWRAHIPIAAAVTFITNPLTLGMWLWLAYRVGSSLIDAPPAVPMSDSAGLFEWLHSIGTPALLGMALFAVVGSLSSYLVVRAVNHALLWRRLWRAARRRELRAAKG